MDRLPTPLAAALRSLAPALKARLVRTGRSMPSVRRPPQSLGGGWDRSSRRLASQAAARSGPFQLRNPASRSARLAPPSALWRRSHRRPVKGIRRTQRALDWDRTFQVKAGERILADFRADLVLAARRAARAYLTRARLSFQCPSGLGRILRRADDSPKGSAVVHTVATGGIRTTPRAGMGMDRPRFRGGRLEARSGPAESRAA